MENFDLKKFLVENELTINSKILDEASSIRQDVEKLARDFEEKGILDKSYISSTGSGAKAKNKIIGKSTKYPEYDEINKAIQDNFKKVGTTALSSAVYSNGTVHFYFYTQGGEFHFIVRRKNYKG